MLDLHRLRLLQEFSARGSIARTAAVLGYTPSAVSQQLAALEREAGTALLDRSARPGSSPPHAPPPRLHPARGVAAARPAGARGRPRPACPVRPPGRADRRGPPS